MLSFLIELWLTEKSYTVPSNKISLRSSFVTSSCILPKQKLYYIYKSYFTFNL